MKLKITNDEYDNLPEALQALYIKRGGQWVLDLEDEVVTVDEMDEKLTTLSDKNRELLDEKKKVEREARLAREKKAAEEEDYKSLYETSMEKIKDLEEQVSSYTKREQTQMIGVAANKVGELLSPNFPRKAKLLSKFAKERLGFHDDKVVVLNDTGKPTAFSLDDLANQMSKSGDYDDLIEGTGGKGAGEQGNKKDTKSGDKWSDFTSSELSEIRKTNPARYEQLKQTR